MQVLKKERGQVMIPRTGAGVFNIRDGLPSLYELDMGYGMTLFHLIRETINNKEMENCLEMVKERKRSGLVSSRDIKEFNKKIQELYPNLLKSKALELAETFGTMQGKDVRVIVAKATNGEAWLAIYGGCPAISSIITSASHRYSIEEYLQKLRLVEELGAWSRTLLASRLFELYYGTSQVEEVVYNTYSTPYNHITNWKIAIKTATPAPSQVFSIYNGRELLLLKNKTPFYLSMPEHVSTHRMSRRQLPSSQHPQVRIGVVRRLRPIFCFEKQARAAS